MSLRHIALIAERDYLENVRTKGFWFSLLALPVLLLALAALPAVILSSQSVDARWTVVDRSGWLTDRLLLDLTSTDMRLLLTALAADDAAAMLSDGQTGKLADAVELLNEDQVEQLVRDAAPLAAALLRDGGTVNTAGNMTEEFADFFIDRRPLIKELTPEASLVRFPYVASPAANEAELAEAIERDALLGYFVIPDDPVADTDDALYVTASLTNPELPRWFGREITRLVRAQRLAEENLDAATVAFISRPVGLTTVALSDDGTTAEATLAETVSQWAPAALVYLLWIAIFSVSQMLLTSTIEEKTNKLVELLLSSVSARELMLGKIIGIALTGTTVVLIWSAALALLLLSLPTLLGNAELDFSGLISNPVYLVSFCLYFVLGYLFYGSLLAAVGSMCSTLKEAQTLMLPIQLFLFLPLIVMIPIARDPDGTLAVVLSYVPPLTPFVMTNRAASPPDWLTYLLTSALMIASIWLMLRLAARVFERGALAGESPATFRRLFQALRR
ncbi:MAG: ABC transporter permease [Pseudomonadaceae bacterium]|nr:ABC transporter permease [Pseudomonadaceae bacterium]